ncbi:ATP-binding cassette domain-containing protein [Sinorhizobium alkalisoli]|uniref:ABC transporter ATP-binding protein n=1 Tax=Sinorhizobium alkalisoli TaxID=1752398 RepID=A0A1E3VBX8_9HYPH|nr:ATP-binding cassette domain-containing protein [Sinorhizobium alkalisoli]MCA1493405.1 ATP-binding cassette domain-containing protein [Ensifer sp. NBAIM29]MCG5484709.1 ATP-binding cassette domain-containing protein [Sinorhizobium meliloti]ODR91069.1 ABC transporter ATP-binding protein [Sinorhizobium alkalisoli]
MQDIANTIPATRSKSLMLSDVRIRLAGRTLLALSATVMPGEILTVMGPSGSGKSTLLAFAGGFLDPAFVASGQIVIGDEDLTRLAADRRHAGILFQDPLLFPHLSVGGNILFAIPQSIRGRRARRELAEQALDEVGLSGFFDRDPETLSGGEKARVALQRVLISAPRFLLLDEPFSKLDMALRQQTRDLVFSKARASGLPAVLVTHDRADAEAAGGPVIEIGREVDG